MRDAAIAQKHNERTVWLVGWALASAVLILNFGADALRQKFYDPDNAMWLVGVRDMLAGQELWDSVQHRLNPPTGTEMHWARWLHATIAAPIAVLTPLFGAKTAEIITAFIWPLALLALFMSLVVRVCGEIGARDGLRLEASIAGALVAALAFPVTAKFSPGSFDHHTIELILAFLAILALIRVREAPHWGAIAGGAFAAIMATAAEGAPIAATGVLVCGLLWLLQPQAYARGLAWLGAAFAGGSVLFFLIMVPPASWGKPVCDAMSASFLGFGLAAGAVALVLAFVLPAAMRKTFGGRVAAAAALGAISLATLWVLFPDCASGGYSAMSAEMKDYWLSQIAEARSLPALAADNFALFLGIAGAPFAAVIAAAFYLSQRWRDTLGWIFLAFLLIGWALLAWQIRGGFFAAAFAIPFGAWAAARARQAWKAGTARTGVLVFVAAAMSSAPAAWSAVSEPLWKRTLPAGVFADYETRGDAAEDCTDPDAYAELRSIAPGVMFNNFMLGPGVLQWTQHSAIAAPYHRDADGLMTMITAMRSDADTAKTIIMRTASDYVLACSALPEMEFYSKHPRGSATLETTLASLLSAGTPPDWLEPMPLEHTPIKLYRIAR
jgi:hypothetical protein